MLKRDRATAGLPAEKDGDDEHDDGSVSVDGDNDDDDNDNVNDKGEDADEEEDELDEDEDDEEDDDDGSMDDEEEPSQSFVAWLDEKGSSTPALSVGELHFSNVEHIGSPDDSYCVVYEMSAVLPTAVDEEDEESPRLYSFLNGFPFRVLPAAACVGIPLEPVANDADTEIDAGNDETSEDDDDDDDIIVCTAYSLDADIHQSLLEELTTSCANQTYTQISPKWRFPSSATTQEAVHGGDAWWKAGVAKTGWDLNQIPKEDRTTVDTMEWSGGSSTDHTKTKKKNGANQNDNILLQLYRDLCAFRPLTAEDSRDDIEERFEWRTCLCTYFAWAVPNEEALALMEQIATATSGILEIGAGTGYWAWLLAQRGVDVVAYDMKESHGGHKHRFRHSMVRDGGVEQASSPEHAGRALFLCWPDIVGDSASDDADRGTFGVDTLQAFTGDTVIYVGELGPKVVRAAKGWGDPFPPGGSTASEAFQTELRAHFKQKDAQGGSVRLPNWPPYNSHLTVWVRK